jgi:hypothetical protein
MIITITTRSGSVYELNYSTKRWRRLLITSFSGHPDISLTGPLEEGCEHCHRCQEPALGKNMVLTRDEDRGDNFSSKVLTSTIMKMELGE